MSNKKFKLIENIVALDGVKSAEVYRKSTGHDVWDILVRLEDDRLVWGTVACKNDLELFEEYLRAIVPLGNSDLESYPNTANEGNVDSE